MRLSRKYQKFLWILTGVEIILFLFLIIRFHTQIVAHFQAPKPLCVHCNIILVSLDTLSANHLPCYGYSRDTAPNLCLLAKNSIFFSHMYSNATWTLPSHVSIFTGLYPYTHGVIDESNYLSRSVPFLPQILKDNGYTTSFLMGINDNTLPIYSVYNRGIDEIYNEDTISWDSALTDFKTNVENGKKTFLFLHTYDVHAPYLIDDRPFLYAKTIVPTIPTKHSELRVMTNDVINFLIQQIPDDVQKHNLGPGEAKTLTALVNDLKKYPGDYDKMRNIIQKAQMEDPIDTKPISAYYSYSILYREHIDTKNSTNVDYLRALYDQRIHEMDTSRIANLLAFLQDKTVRDNTIVIITADHGEEFMEHGQIEHATTYDSNIRIPLIMYIPNTAKKTIDANVQSVDLLPTILDIVGIKTHNTYQGLSLVPAIGGTPLPDRILVADGDVELNRTLRRGNWKLFLYPKDNQWLPTELYDIQKDPGEQNNVLFSHLDIARTLFDDYQAMGKK
ncbi:MAG TPA: sulfatase [Patescibacteria group bacterium]|nr:sulfatase [Patescibacteria group bacterium]